MDFSKLNEAIHFAAGGKYGSPQWNPAPHPEADPEVVAKRDSDPLWQYHRNLRDYSGNMPKSPTWPGGPRGYEAIHYKQKGGWDEAPTMDLPEGFQTRAESRDEHQRNQTAAAEGQPIEPSFDLVTGAYGLGPESPNQERYQNLFNYHGAGRRPWHKTVFALQDLSGFGKPHDPYRLLAQSVRTGNRHALPLLVDHLKKRDNPAGWYDGWAKLAKAMHERIGDLPEAEIRRRAGEIGRVTVGLSANPDEHRKLAAGAVESPDTVGYHALADHMEENGLPQYAQLLRSELANLDEGLRTKPKRKNSRL